MMFLSRPAWTLYMIWHTRGQARYPFLPPDRIKRDQSRRVRRIIAYAWRHVPYYRETMQKLGLTPADFRTAEDLAKLPVLRREHIQCDPEYFMSVKGDRTEWLELRSSGTTGFPLTVFHGRAEVMYLAALSARFRTIVQRTIGKKLGYRESHILHHIASNGKVRDYWVKHALIPADFPAKVQRLPMSNVPEENIPRLNEFQPDAIYTYGSYLGLLFETIHDLGLSFHKPKLVAFGADDIPRSSRRLIQEKFGIPVFSMYHSIECSRMGFECEKHLGVHINVDVFPLRIADAQGRSLPDGEQGEVVVSNLLNRATVLLNYHLGDLARFLPPCPCRRSLPLLSFPQGRCNDWIILPSGKRLHSANIIDLGEDWGSGRQWQIVQDTTSHFTVKLVLNRKGRPSAVSDFVRKHLTGMLGKGVVVDVRFVDSIEPMAGDKHRTFVSLVTRR